MFEMKRNDEKNQIRFGLVFLLGYTVLGAYLNRIGALNILSAFLNDHIQNSLVTVIFFWSAFILLFLPIYWVFVRSIYKWDWSLDQWGFGLKKNAWIGIFFSVLPFLLVMLQSNKQAGVSTRSLPVFMLFFESYARIAEELLYRGFALILFKRIFQKTGSSTLWAIILSSALFTLMHTHKPDQMLNIFIAAVLIAGFTIWSGSISFAFIWHTVSNGGLICGLITASFFIITAIFNNKMKKTANNSIHLTGKPAGDGRRCVKKTNQYQQIKRLQRR